MTRGLALALAFVLAGAHDWELTPPLPSGPTCAKSQRVCEMVLRCALELHPKFQLRARTMSVCPKCGAPVGPSAPDGDFRYRPPKTSDGYHTFSELYEHRHRLFISLCRFVGRNAVTQGCYSPVWRSRLHHDGTMYPGWFVMGIHEVAGEQITYHLPDRLWSDTVFATEVTRAPEWDGHSPADVLDRLVRL